MSFFKKYQDSLILLTGLLLGMIAGLVFGEKTAVVKPVGDIFLNLMYMVLIPLVFFSISSAIGQMKSQSRLGKILVSTVLVFLFTAFVSAIIGYVGVRLFPLIKEADTGKLLGFMEEVDTTETMTIQERVVALFTVDDFSKLLSKANMLPMIVFSLLTGLATSASGEKGEPFAKFLASGNVVVMKMVNYIMRLAPLGLGCYFAVVIGQLGGQIINGYVKTFALYVGLALIYFFGIMSIYAFLAGGKNGLRNFWKYVPVPAATAIATSSSAASIPANLEYTKKIGVSADIVDTVIPLGANIHKDGSVIGGIFKISFLFLLFGKDMTSLSSILAIIFGGFFVGAVMGAIPGGGLIAETLIVSLFGFPTGAIPLLIIIATIIDIPATLLNSTGNVASAMLVSRLVDKKNNFSVDKN